MLFSLVIIIKFLVLRLSFFSNYLILLLILIMTILDPHKLSHALTDDKEVPPEVETMLNLPETLDFEVAALDFFDA